MVGSGCKISGFEVCINIAFLVFFFSCRFLDSLAFCYCLAMKCWIDYARELVIFPALGLPMLSEVVSTHP